MQKVFLLFLMLGLMANFAFATPEGEAQDSDGETNEFWPPDMVPHPHPPGGPKGRDAPDLA